MSIYTECLRFVFNEKTLPAHCTATNTIHVRFGYSIGLVRAYMWLYQHWSSLDLKVFTEVWMR